MAEFLACEPNVFVIGNDYQIVLNLAEPGPCFVRVGDRNFYEDGSGIFYNDRCVHKISVPQSVLDEAESYTVMYRRMIERRSYCSRTGDMQSEAAAKIDRGLGNEVREESAQSEQNVAEDFQPVLRKTRKPGTGCITQINHHLFEGRYSPTWPDGTKHSKCVYAHTREECEAKLKVLIQQMNTERKAILDRMHGIVSPDKLTKKQRQIWEYMNFHSDETNYSVIARGATVTRHTVTKWYEMIQGMVTYAV